MKSEIHPRDRTERGHRMKRVAKNTQPPTDQGGWFGTTAHWLESVAVRTCSPNARRALDRLVLEHIRHGRCRNGELVVTHGQFIEWGVTAEYVGDALDELAFKGLLAITRGRAGNGTAHPNVFRLTFDGTMDGAAATNEWKRCTKEDAVAWVETVRKAKAARRSAVGAKRKSSLRVSEIPPLRVSEIRGAA